MGRTAREGLYVCTYVLTYVRSIIVFVCILPEKAVREMTYTVSSGTLNSTHSLMDEKPAPKKVNGIDTDQEECY